MPQHSVKSESMWKIPTFFTPLIGREHEVATICAFLQQPDVRLLTLLGIGGIGKTRLAVQATTNLRPYFTDGACFVALSAVTDPDQVIPTLAQELGILERQGTKEQPLFDLVKVSLQDRHFLLLLDNIEQVVTAAPYIEELLMSCPDLKVLVTSRVVLHLQAEQQFPVPPLGLPDSKPLPEYRSLTEYPAVALFVQRARTILPHFQLTEANAQAIAEICIHLDGLPLAIELAAARIKLLSPAALLTRLSQRFDLLTGEPRRHPPRHQTLRKTLQWSYDLLESEEQRLFRQLSVFVGSFSLEAVEAVRNASNEMKGSALSTLEGITSLLDKSLLLRSDEEGEEGDEPRFYLLETVREYGLECLRQREELESSQQAYAMYYLAFVERAEPHLKDTQQLRWLTLLDLEQENLRAALGWLIEHQETESALRFCTALWRFWQLRGYWSEGRDWLKRALRMTQVGPLTAARAKALYSAGELASLQDDEAVAQSLLEESVALCRLLGSKKDIANALGALGVLLYKSDPVAARPLLEESEALYSTLNSTWELAYLLRKLATLALRQGDRAQATIRAQEALLLAQFLGDKYLSAAALGTLAQIAQFQGDLKHIIALNQEYLALAQELGDKYLSAIALQNIGYYSALQGDLTQATAVHRGLTLARELGTKRLITATMHSVGFVAECQGNLAEATAWYRQGLALAQEIRNNREIGWHLTGLASVAAAEGQFYQAAHILGAAEKRFDIKVNMHVVERTNYEHMVEKIRTQLGEQVFAAAWTAGRNMTPEQALAAPTYPPVSETAAPPELPTTPAGIPAPKSTSKDKASRRSYPAGLTAREAEVLQQLAQGLSDAEIAQRLVISERTVGKHLENIFQKIGVNNRGAAIRYTLDNGLA